MQTARTSSRKEQEVLTAIGWQGRLNEASTRADVVRVAREFLARCTPTELATIPDECRPTKLVDAEDISQAALGLVQCSCSGDRMADAPLQRMAGFFTRATVRLAQITAHSAEVSAEDR